MYSSHHEGTGIMDVVHVRSDSIAAWFKGFTRTGNSWYEITGTLALGANDGVSEGDPDGDLDGL